MVDDDSITYEVIDEWSIPGGRGKRIVFPRAHLSHAYVEKLAQKLNEDTKDDRHAVVLMFTDRQAAATHRNLCDTTPEQEQMNLCTHYIGDYIRHDTPKVCTVFYCLDGLIEGSECKVFDCTHR
ncbi:MAG: hypothetical protein ACXV49_08235 [Halobacteriota archaeon]